ncbi:MAG: immune inhibitor A [Bacteroidia bacterium]|nr:immune inhibitor A [Bacteroidia bacterium]
MLRYCIFLLFLPAALWSQQEVYSRVKVYTGANGTETLSSLGLELDHGVCKPGFWIINDFSATELDLIRSKGFQTEVIIPDVQAWYLENSQKVHSQTQSIGCTAPPTYPTPSNFTLGSMGGFFTYNEIISHLDNMYTLYPNLIKQKATLPYQTTQSRPLYWLKISDNPSVDENEPEILYTGVHHAREPASVAQLIMYMYYLLENYATDPEVQYLVDNSEMYFVPLVNPDGYMYNQTTNPNGGGMWRKNRRNNGDGTYGVDLNRNYGYNWGFDNNGSSPNTNSSTYRGPSAFSEPETQNLRDFCNQHQFRLCLNYHTYGNLMIYPWGYDANIYTPDSAQFTTYGDHLTTYNKYSYGTANQTVLYTANGVSDDWMYGEQSTKPKIFAFTPEAGLSDEGFWPPQSRIIDICKENIWQNLHACHLVLKYAYTTDDEPNYISATAGYLNYRIKRLGMDAPGTYTVTIVPLGPEITSVGPPKTYSSLGLLQEVSDSISYTLMGNLAGGQVFKYVIEVNNGAFTLRDTIVKRFGWSTIVFSNNGSNLTGFTNNGWGTTTQQFWSPGSSITDSPSGNYSNNAYETITTSSLNLSNAVTAQLSFYARWELETNFDWVQVKASSDGGNTWTPLCGKYTKTGNGYQDPGEPVYDAYVFGWKKETMPLDNFIGMNILIRFEINTDNGGSADGFYFDDVLVEKIVQSPTGTAEEPLQQTEQNMPNPADQYTFINFSGVTPGVPLLVYDITGRKVMEEPVPSGTGSIRLNTSVLQPGVYFYRLGNGPALRMSVVH